MRRPCPGRAGTPAPLPPARRPISGRSPALCVLLLTGSVVLATAAPASAHTALVSSTPAVSAVVAGPVEAVSLVFTEPVSTRAAQVVLTGPDGADVVQGTPTVSGATVSAPVTVPAAGRYRLAYRVLAADGHPVTGSVPFEVTPAATSGRPTAPDAPTAGAGAPSTPAADTGSAQGAGGTTPSSGAGLAPVALGGLGAVAGALVVGAVRAGRRSRVAR